MLSSVKQKNRLLVRSVYNSFGSDQRVKNFPISPHTTIYKFPIPAITSIMNRFTGLGITAGFVLFAAGSLVNPAFAGCAVAWLKLHPTLLAVTKFGLSYGASFHTLGGLRHLYWDFSSKGLDNISQMDISSRIIFWFSLVIACTLVFVY